ncbi:MAG: SLAC1 anion channel family protein [Rubrivivax sp.]|nr:SLAC1 anion channel family protein [Rubrivivax sp.]
MTTPNAPAQGPQPESRLRHFPISFFAVVMGLAGFSIAWSRAESILHLPFAIGGALGWLAAVAFALIALTYLLKFTRYPGEVAKEFRHPIRVNFFPAASIGLILLSIVAFEPAPGAARVLWSVGTALHLVLTLVVMNRWIHHPGIEMIHVNPAWFIPVVGNILVPIVGVRLFPAEVSWFFFSIGLVLWPVLLTIVLNRLFFHAPLPPRLTPTLFILVAPPAVACIAYVALTDRVDAMAHVLYSAALFFTLLLSTSAARFLRTPFFLSAWAYSFPLAAMTIASLMMLHRVGGSGYAWIAIGLLVVLTLVIALLLVRTAVAMARHQVCVEE